MLFTQDFVLNGEAHGDVAQMLDGVRFDPGLLRPYIDEHNRQCVTVNTGQKKFDKKANKYVPVVKKIRMRDLAHMGVDLPTVNAASLRKNEWILLDQQVIRAARARLRAWADLAAANTFGGFDGMSKMVLEHETMSDPGEAQVDMDGLAESRTDSPKYQLEGLPLPITHSGFFFSSRRLAVSRNTNTPLDTTMGEACGRRVAETIEKTLIGVESGVTYGKSTDYSRASTVYGYTNFPDRIVKTDLTVPTGSNPEATVSDVLEMRDSLYDAHFYGPFMLYHSTDWDNFMDNDYARLGGSNANMTLRDRLRKIEGIQDVKRLDFLTSTYTMIMVQMTADVARAVNGMNITTVQWESKGGAQVNFKVMAIQVPQLRADFNGNTGLLHATTA